MNRKEEEQKKKSRRKLKKREKKLRKGNGRGGRMLKRKSIKRGRTRRGRKQGIFLTGFSWTWSPRTWSHRSRLWPSWRRPLTWSCGWGAPRAVGGDARRAGRRRRHGLVNWRNGRGALPAVNITQNNLYNRKNSLCLHSMYTLTCVYKLKKKPWCKQQQKWENFANFTEKYM